MRSTTAALRHGGERAGENNFSHIQTNFTSYLGGKSLQAASIHCPNLHNGSFGSNGKNIFVHFFPNISAWPFCAASLNPSASRPVTWCWLKLPVTPPLSPELIIIFFFFFTSSFLLLLFMHSVFISTWQSDSPAVILGSVAGLAEGGGIVVGGASLLR